MTMRFKKFDIRRIRSDDLIVIIGKKRIGKSYLVKDIMYHQRDIPTGVVITHENDHSYDHYVPKALIYQNYYESDSRFVSKSCYQSEILKNLLTYQQRRNSFNWSDTVDRRVFCIMEDVILDKDKNLITMIMNARSLRILPILVFQYPVKMSPMLRHNISYLMIFSSVRLEEIHSQFGIFPTFDIFQEAIELLGEYECLVIHLDSLSNKLEDIIFWYKAEEHSDFRLCRDEIWQISEEACLNE